MSKNERLSPGFADEQTVSVTLSHTQPLCKIRSGTLLRPGARCVVKRAEFFVNPNLLRRVEKSVSILLNLSSLSGELNFL